MEDSYLSNLPEVPGFEYMILWFGELGFASSYDKPYGYAEIQSWSEATGTAMTHWHATQLREMSSAYVVQLAKSKSRLEPPPYYHDDRSVEQRRADVAEKFKALPKKRKTRNG